MESYRSYIHRFLQLDEQCPPFAYLLNTLHLSKSWKVLNNIKWSSCDLFTRWNKQWKEVRNVRYSVLAPFHFLHVNLVDTSRAYFHNASGFIGYSRELLCGVVHLCGAFVSSILPHLCVLQVLESVTLWVSATCELMWASWYLYVYRLCVLRLCRLFNDRWTLLWNLGFCFQLESIYL